MGLGRLNREQIALVEHCSPEIDALGETDVGALNLSIGDISGDTVVASLGMQEHYKLASMDASGSLT